MTRPPLLARVVAVARAAAATSAVTAAVTAAVAAAVTAAAAGGAGAQELTYTSAVQYSSGSYIFTEPTRTLSLYNGLTLRTGPLRLSASLPVIVQNSGAVTVVGGAYLPTGGEEAAAVGGRKQGQSVPMGPGSPHHSPRGPVATPLAEAEAGSAVVDSQVEEPGSYGLSVGDPLVYGGLELYSGLGALRSLEVTGSVKPPVNRLDSGVGTGEWDWAVGGAVAAALGPVLTFFDASYWWYGDIPGLELRDGVSWGAGLGFPLSRRLWASAMATAMNRVIESAEPARSVSAGVSYRIGDAGTLSFTLGRGLTETAPDLALSLGWRGRLLGP